MDFLDDESFDETEKQTYAASGGKKSTIVRTNVIEIM